MSKEKVAEILEYPKIPHKKWTQEDNNKISNLINEKRLSIKIHETYSQNIKKY